MERKNEWKEERQQKNTAKSSVPVVMLSFSAVIVLFVGIFLLAVSLWTFARKMFVYTYFMEIHMDSTFFAIPAGAISFPAVVLTVLLKSNKLNYLLMFLGLHIIAVTILFTGYFMGMQYKLDYSNEIVQLRSTIPREALNHTLYKLIINYEDQPENYTALDRIQNKFSCCGVDGQYSFIMVPDSCCPKYDCEKNDFFSKGCLRSIQEDVAWHKHVTMSVTQIFIMMYIFNVTMGLSVFVSDHFKWKSIHRNINQKSRG